MEESLQQKYNVAQEARDAQQAPGAAAPRAAPSPSAYTSPTAPTPKPVFTSESTAGTVSFSRLAQVCVYLCVCVCMCACLACKLQPPCLTACGMSASCLAQLHVMSCEHLLCVSMWVGGR